MSVLKCVASGPKDAKGCHRIKVHQGCSFIKGFRGCHPQEPGAFGRRGTTPHVNLEVSEPLRRIYHLHISLCAYCFFLTAKCIHPKWKL